MKFCFHSVYFLMITLLVMGGISHPIKADETDFRGILTSLTDRAVSNNSDIWAGEARVAMAMARIAPAGALADPMLMVQYQNEGWSVYSYGDTPGSEWMVGISQEIALGGKLDTRQAMMRLSADKTVLDLRMAQVRLITQIREAYFDYYGITQSLRLLGRAKAVLTQLDGLALSRYAAGTEEHDQVLMTSLDQYMLDEKILMQEARLSEIKSRLITLCQITDDQLMPTPNELPITHLAYSEAEAHQMAADHSLDIQDTLLMQKMAETQTLMARQETLPDITLNTAMTKKAAGMADMWLLGVSIPLQLNAAARQLPKIREAESGEIEGLAQIRARQQAVSADLTTDWAMMAATEHVVHLYDAMIMPNLAHLIEVSLANYQNGKMSLPQVLSKIRDLSDTQINAVNARVDHEKAVARLQAMVNPLEVLHAIR